MSSNNENLDKYRTSLEIDSCSERWMQLNLNESTIEDIWLYLTNKSEDLSKIINILNNRSSIKDLEDPIKIIKSHLQNTITCLKEENNVKDIKEDK
ncbi:MAG: hypothetical protein MHPSP_003794, partial [Paramarteilia canceri]